MKYFLALLFLIPVHVLHAASNQNSVTWTELESGVKYELNFDIQLSDTVKISRGDGFVFEQSMSGGMFIYLSFLNLQCIDEKLTTELILFNPEPEDVVYDKSIGLSHEDGCRLSVYVETKFIADRSLFLLSK